MNTDNRSGDSDARLDQLLDRATEQIRDDRLDAEFERGAIDRVWQRLEQNGNASPSAARVVVRRR